MFINKKTVKKATDFAFSVCSPKFLFPIHPLAGKLSNRWNVLTFLQSYIKILEMCKKNLISPTANTFKAQFTAEIFPSKQLWHSATLGNTGHLELKLSES